MGQTSPTAKARDRSQAAGGHSPHPNVPPKVGPFAQLRLLNSTQPLLRYSESRGPISYGLFQLWA